MAIRNSRFTRRSIRSFSKPTLTLVLVCFLFVTLLIKIWVAFQYKFLVWDSYVYLLNARVFLHGISPDVYFELGRPPLLPYFASLLWRISGESVPVLLTINPLLSVGCAFILYKWGSEMFNDIVGAFAASFFLTVPAAFFWTNQVLTHGFMLFFLTLAAYSLWKGASGEPLFYAVAGPAAALASLSRYTAILILPIAAIYLALVASRNDVAERRKTKFLAIGFLTFIMIWLPWLRWNLAVASNPFASLFAGSAFVTQKGPMALSSGGSLGPWYYYLFNIESILTIPGVVLLLAGLASKRLYANARTYIVPLWAGIFLAFYSIATVKEDRFYVDFIPPLALVMGCGLDTLVSFLGKKRRYVKPFVFAVTAIWLLSLSSMAVRISAENAAFNNNYFQSRGLVQVAGWLNSNMNQTDIGASNLGPYLSYFTERNFLSIDSLLDESASGGMQLSQLLAELHVKYVVVTSEYARINQLSSLTMRTTIGDFRVYASNSN